MSVGRIIIRVVTITTKGKGKGVLERKGSG